MVTLSNLETHEIDEMVFHLYATAESVPECPLDQEKFLSQAIETATDFSQSWRTAGLPESRMLSSFRDEFIRNFILMDVRKYIQLTDQILDRLEESWKQREHLSPQRQIIRQCEKKHKHYQQAQWSGQQS